MSARLDDYGDVLTIAELCAVLQISERRFRELRQHNAFPIPEIEHLHNRFSKTDVRRFLDGATRLGWRQSHARRIA